MAAPVTVIGVDPGIKGATCLLVPHTGAIHFIDHEVFITNPSVWGKTILEWNSKYYIRMAGVEKVRSLPKVSAAANFSFGYQVGGVEIGLGILGIPFDRIYAKDWQKEIGIKPKSPTLKKDVAAAASRLYPNCSIYGPRGGLLDGRSDALMIAHYTSIKYAVG